MVGREATKAVVQWFVAVVMVVLALRFLFRLFGVEGGEAGFINWLYQTTDVLLQPFRAIYPNMGAVNGQFVLELPTLFAVAAYMVVGNVVEGVVDRLSAKRK
jgi:uncharacterized protein YggT (Ycf19 family)